MRGRIKPTGEDEFPETAGKHSRPGIHRPFKPQTNFKACFSLQWLIQSIHSVWHPVGPLRLGAVVHAAGRQGITAASARWLQSL